MLAVRWQTEKLTCAGRFGCVVEHHETVLGHDVLDVHMHVGKRLAGSLNDLPEARPGAWNARHGHVVIDIRIGKELVEDLHVALVEDGLDKSKGNRFAGGRVG